MDGEPRNASKPGNVPRYRTILADPPWPFQWGGGKGGRRRRETELGYKTMTIEEIAALDVASLADEICNLFLWATDEVYREGNPHECKGFDWSGLERPPISAPVVRGDTHG